MRAGLRAALVALATVLAGAAANAGELVAPAEPAPAVVRTRVEALVLWSGGREELIVRAGYRSEAPAGPGPAQLAWVLPVPVAPAVVAAAPPGLFEEWAGTYLALDLEQVIDAGGDVREERVRRLGASAVRPGAGIAPVAVLEPHVLAGTGAAAVEALERWLAEGGFRPIPPAACEPYVAQGWSLVVVRVRPREGDSALPIAATLPPVRVSFPAAAPVFPARLAAGRHPFDLVVTWITRERPVYAAGRGVLLLPDLVLSLDRRELGPDFDGLLQAIQAEGRLDPATLRFVLRTHRERVDGPGRRLADQTRDPTVAFE